MAMQKIMLSAIAAAVLTVPVLTILRRNGTVGRATEKRIAKAREAGCVVTARLSKAVHTRGDPLGKTEYERAELWLCRYRYEVAGRTYTFRIQMQDKPPETLELFYPEGNPGRAICQGMPDHSAPNLLAALLPVLAWAILYYLVFS